MFQPPLPGALLSQLMTPSLQWLQRERAGGGGIGVNRPSHCRAQTQNPKPLPSGPCRVQTISPLPAPSSLGEVPRRVGATSRKVLLRHTFFRQQLPFKERTVTLLRRELTSGPETGYRCLQVDSPLLESGRSTGSYKTKEQRKVSQLGGWGRDRHGQEPTPQPARGIRTQKKVMASPVTCDTCPGSGEASLAPGTKATAGSQV